METIKEIKDSVVMFRTHEDVVKARGSIKEASRKWWVASAQKVLSADYAFAIIDDIVRGVYKVKGYNDESDDGSCYPGFKGIRKAFDFVEAPASVKENYLNKALPVEFQNWGQNPIRYNF